MSRRLGPVLAVALVLRLVPILFAGRVVADVLRYQKAASHVLDVSWNPYLAPRLYPYPPLWIWIEAGSEWLARATGLSFAVVVKLPVLLADLGIVTLLACWPLDSRVGQRASWLFALHPVSILVTSFHGQFDSIMLFFVLLSLRFQQSGRFDASALSLSAAIATKSFPALLLPIFLTAQGVSRAFRYLLLATLPVLLLLLPYAVAGPARWPAAIPAAKALFFVVYLAGLGALARRRLPWTPPQAALAVFLAFLTLYGAISAQYLLWPVPLGALLPSAWFAAYSLAATVALGGFYLFLAPGVLTAATVGPLGPHPAGVAWACGTAAVLVASGAWLAALVRRGRASA